MNKSELIRRLNELAFDKNEYWLITGGAMVLYGLRAETSDVDLGCSSKMADRLENKGYPTIVLDDGTRKITVDEDVEIFENWIFDTVNMIDDIPVISLNGLMEMKKSLGREKDCRDIELIEKYLGKAQE